MPAPQVPPVSAPDADREPPPLPRATLAYASKHQQAAWSIGLKPLIAIAGVLGVFGFARSAAMLWIVHGGAPSRVASLVAHYGTTVEFAVAAANALLVVGAVAFFAGIPSAARQLLIVGAAVAAASIAFRAFRRTDLLPLNGQGASFMFELSRFLHSLLVQLAVPVLLLSVLTRRRVAAVLTARARGH